MDFDRARSFIRENSNLIITSADKGNVTAVLSRSDYETKMEALVIV